MEFSKLDGDTACRVTKKVQPKNLSDISAISAIARPGALAFLDDFLESRKTGKIKSIYPPIDKILANTFGVILYQEQTMKIAHEVYKFSLVEADILRKIIGKKQLEKVKEWKKKLKKLAENRAFQKMRLKFFGKPFKHLQNINLMPVTHTPMDISAASVLI